MGAAIKRAASVGRSKESVGGHGKGWGGDPREGAVSWGKENRGEARFLEPR